MIEIIITRRANGQDWLAQVEGNPKIFGQASTREEAIGNMITSNPEFFNLELIGD